MTEVSGLYRKIQPLASVLSVGCHADDRDRIRIMSVSLVPVRLPNRTWLLWSSTQKGFGLISLDMPRQTASILHIPIETAAYRRIETAKS